MEASEQPTPQGEELHPDQVPGYEPHFDPTGTTRRVLGHVTDEDHVGRGARNTVERLTVELAEDPYTAIEFNERDVVQNHLDELEKAGLVARRQDDTYEVTEAGMVELRN